MAADPLVIFARRPRWLNQGETSTFAARLQREVAGGKAFCCRITSDEELRRLNRDFREKDEATDVLSFPGDGLSYLGDLAISADRAAAQAEEHGHEPGREICILMLHGLLHLLGYDHETDRGKMRRVEKKWRQTLGLPSGLIERAGRR